MLMMICLIGYQIILMEILGSGRKQQLSYNCGEKQFRTLEATINVLEPLAPLTPRILRRVDHNNARIA